MKKMHNFTLKTKLSLFIIISLLLSACNSSSNTYKQPEYIKIADRITFATVKKIQKEKKLILIGSGGSMMFNVKEVSLHFVCNEPYNMTQARKLLLDITEQLLFAFNTDQSIQPYLSNTPFDAKNVHIIISFIDKKNRSHFIDSIDSASICNDILSYNKYNSEKNVPETFFEEHYNEAIQKAQISINDIQYSQQPLSLELAQ